MNTLKTGLLMAALTMLFVLLGRWIGGQSGMIMAFVLALGMNFFSYWYSDKMVLAMTRAQPVDPAQAPELYAMVSRLAERAGIPMPSLYVVPDETPNAFATGRNPQHAAVAVNEGLLRILNQPEVEGVIAHEIAHIKHRDILISTIAATMAGALMMIANMGQYAMMFGGMSRSDDEEGGVNPLAGLLLIIVAPIAALIIQSAISRAREYMADEYGGRLTGRPMNLASALLRLEQGNAVLPPAHASPATAHMYIVNPLHGGIAGLFSTHPATEDRVARLQALEAQLRRQAVPA